jgi:cytochrome b involved in lipid metabolism
MNIEILKQSVKDITNLNKLSNYYKEFSKKLYRDEIISRLKNMHHKIEADEYSETIIVDSFIPVIISTMFQGEIRFYHPIDWEKKEEWSKELTDWQIKVMERCYPFKDELFENLTTDNFFKIEDISYDINAFFKAYPLITKKLTNFHKTGIFEHIKSFNSF